MSLISIRNFVAPLQSRFNVGLIIVVAVLIAAMRLSGGKIEVDKPLIEQRRARQLADEASARGRLNADEAAKARRKEAPKRDELLDQLLKTEPAASRKADNREVMPPRKSGEFDDIRKSLGLE